MDLASAVLIKDNHLRAVGGDVRRAVELVRAELPPGAEIEVEADDIEQVIAALAAGAERILLDNMSLDDLRECVDLVSGRARLEASGGVTLATVRAIANTGVDDISVGALTHSAPSLDLGLDFD
jgi:nicotinate-nucleotide pyrophosphorylase (carboxylating)